MMPPIGKTEVNRPIARSRFGTELFGDDSGGRSMNAPPPIACSVAKADQQVDVARQAAGQ